MGLAKRQLEEQEGVWDAARSSLIDVGCLEECENHPGTYFDGGEDIETAYKIANSRITSGDIALAKGEGRRDYTDLLKRVYEDNSALEGCPVWMICF